MKTVFGKLYDAKLDALKAVVEDEWFRLGFDKISTDEGKKLVWMLFLRHIQQYEKEELWFDMP